MTRRSALLAALVCGALQASPGAAQDPRDDGLQAGFERAQALAGSDPGRARSLIETLRQTAVAQHRPAWRLALDELDCRLLSDIDPAAGLKIAQVGLASLDAPAQTDTTVTLPRLRLKVCHAGLTIDFGQEAAGLAELEAVLATATTPALEAGRAMALLERGLRRSRRGDYAAGQHDLLAACAALREAALAFDQALCTWHLANHFKRVGDQDEALNLLKPLLADARQRGARQDEGIYLYGIAQVHGAREDWSQAMQSFSDALTIETAKGDAMGMAYAEFGLGDAMLKLGRPQDALPRMRHALAQFVVLKDEFQVIQASIAQSEAQLLVGQVTEAAAVLRSIEAAVRARDDEVTLAAWLSPQGDALARLGQWREAYVALAAHREITTRLDKRKLSQQTARLRLQFNREHDEQDIRTLQLANQQGQRLRQLQAVALTLFVLLLAATLAYAVHKVRESRRLRTLSLSDELTGLANRRATLAQLQAGVRAARDKEGTLSVLMIDVDHFKRVNDTHGHAAGDDVLRHLARVLPAGLRSLDRLGRLGGEEFLAMLPDASEDQAVTIAERMRARVAAAHAATGAGPLAITVSIGVATLDGRDESAAALIDRADHALYAAKDRGRNTVVRASP